VAEVPPRKCQRERNFKKAMASRGKDLVVLLGEEKRRFVGQVDTSLNLKQSI
jgi:hypothetical protein